jgi:hypothetical protein
MIDIYDVNGKHLVKDFVRCEDRQAAELRAEADRDWLDPNGSFEVTRIR